MNDKNVKKTLIRWAVPCVVLILFLYVLVLRFTVVTRITEKKEVEKSMISVTEGYASKFQRKVAEMAEVAVPLIEYIATYAPDDSDKDVATILEEQTDAYMVVICDNSGQGVTHAGSWINVANRDYFPQKPLEQPTACWSSSDGVQGRECIVTIVPVLRDGEPNGYVFLFYSVDDFANLIRKMEFDSSAFYAVVDSDGTVICSYGAEHEFLKDNDFWNVVCDRGQNKEEINHAVKNMNKGHSGMIVVESPEPGKGTVLNYASTNINDWCMIVGVSQDYLEMLERREWAQTSTMLNQLVTFLITFIVIMVIVNIAFKIVDAKKRKELVEKADTDLLTGLNNKIATERKISEYLVQNPDSRNALFVLDIDNFKKINDTMGHAFGDEVLRALGHEIIEEFRITDIIGRSGGDEFMVFLKDIKEDEMVYREGKKLEEFFKKFRVGEYVKYSVTASIGGAVFPDAADCFEDLYKKADHALYTAKERGKNQLAFYGKIDERYQEDNKREETVQND